MQNSKRWGIAVAGFVLQIALGAVYAWSVFRIPLMQTNSAGRFRRSRSLYHQQSRWTAWRVFLAGFGLTRQAACALVAL